MSSPPDSAPPSTPPSGGRRPTVFLSYASEDRPAAQALREALPTHGVEVWYDETDLAGGDAWDQKIRRQIRDCDFFMPLISARTEARHEGYFRREWRLAAERSLDMADDHLFLLPVVIDDTPQFGARVPEKFLSVQWTRVPDGKPTAAFEALCRRLLQGDTRPSPAQSRVSGHPPAGASFTRPPPSTEPPPSPGAAPLDTASASDSSRSSGPFTGAPGPEPRAQTRVPPSAAFAAAGRRRGYAPAGDRPLPPFPNEVPGQRPRFVLEVIVWLIESGWILFQRLPRPLRLLAYIWLAISLTASLNRCDDDDDVRLSHSQAKKLQAIAEGYQGKSPQDLARLGTQISQALGGDASAAASAGTASGAPLLAIPFSAPADAPEARKLADAAFVEVYGRLALSHHGHASLLEEPLPGVDDSTALARAKAQHADYVLFGNLSGTGRDARLTVRLLEVDDGSEAWSKSYPAEGLDTAAVATEVDQRVHEHE